MRVLAYFVRSPGEVQGVRQALGLPLRVVRMTVPLSDIERRLASDVTPGWIHDYNHNRRHSACQMMPPVDYVRVLAAGEAA